MYYRRNKKYQELEFDNCCKYNNRDNYYKNNACGFFFGFFFSNKRKIL